jgi:SET domain-containing protein
MMRHPRGTARFVRRKRYVVRDSAIHGRGVFARRPIKAGEFVIDYRGAVLTWEEASNAFLNRGGDHGHTMLFDLGDDLVIDGAHGGNEARFINHGCEPNCEAVITGRTIEIHAARDIAKGEELLLDYQLQADLDDADRAAYACRCGAAGCRSSMLAEAGSA